MSACKDGDLDHLVAMMTDDVTLYSDGGGKVQAALRPVQGALNVARFLIGVSKKAATDTEVKPVVVNGRPGLAVFLSGVLERVFSLEFSDSGLQAICVVGNPDKLKHLRH